jgi:hypothetical protein
MWWAGSAAIPRSRFAACAFPTLSRVFARKGKPWPPMSGTVHPESLGRALAPFRIRPEEIDAETLRSLPACAGCGGVYIGTGKVVA